MRIARLLSTTVVYTTRLQDFMFQSHVSFVLDRGPVVAEVSDGQRYQAYYHQHLQKSKAVWI